MPRRTLNLATLDDVAAEIDRLQRDGYSPTGKWNLSQICDRF